MKNERKEKRREKGNEDLVGEKPEFEFILIEAVGQSSDGEVVSILSIKLSCLKIKENVIQAVLWLHLPQFLEDGHGLLSKRRVLGVVGEVQELELQRSHLGQDEVLFAFLDKSITGFQRTTRSDQKIETED
jgi:hypothetical protein